MPVDSDWFPIRITAVLGGGAYQFQEVWATLGGTIADKIGGRINTSFDPAYAIDSSTFAVTAAGSAVQTLARRAVGAGGVQWELVKTSGGSATELTCSYLGGFSATTTGSAAYWAGHGIQPAFLGMTGNSGVGTWGAHCMAHGAVDRTGGAGAIELRIGFAIVAIADVTDPLPNGSDLRFPIIFTCPNNVRTPWSISGFVRDAIDGAVGSAIGVSVEVTSGGSPTGGTPPFNIYSGFTTLPPGNVAGTAFG